MSSVWKRLQRVGKKASKFQFTATYQSLTVECTRGGKWQPNKLIVVWTRRKRRKVSKSMSWQPGISNPFRGIIVWPEPEPVDITVTLYKDSKPGSQFEDKEWTFVIEDESQNGRRKPIASGAINMVDYASVEYRTFDVELTLKLSKKELVSGCLDFTLSCVLIKEGMATDEDMISIGSMLSLNENYYLDHNDEDMEVTVVPSPKPRHKRNLSQGNIKVPAVSAVQNSDGFTTLSPSASPVPGAERRKRGRIRSKSALGENTKTLTSVLQKEELKRLSTGSDTSFDASDARELTRDKSKMESELINFAALLYKLSLVWERHPLHDFFNPLLYKWARSRTKGYKGVKVKNMTTCWKDGLAFCAILHSFHPEKIDFASLDPQKVKQNNKLAFSAFGQLGIPRLLEPAQMMLTSVPDKLSVMTYVYQIKAHFSRQPPASLSSKKPGIRTPKQFRFSEEESEPSEKPVDVSGGDMVVAPSCSSNVTRKKDSADEGRGEGADQAVGQPSGEGGYPFLDDEETMTEAATVDTSESGTSEMQRKESNDAEEQPSILVEKYSKEEVLDHEPSLQSKEDPVKSELGAPPKPPRLYPNKESLAVGHSKCKSADVTRAVTSKDVNPFENSVDDEVVSTCDTNQEPKPTKGPSEGYNPFDEDESMEDESQGKLSDAVVKQTKEGYNPFDDDDDDDDGDEAEERKEEKDVDKKPSKEKCGGVKRTVSYPHGFNPFDEDAESDSVAVKPKESVPNKKAQLTIVKSYNPFDDGDEDGENQNTKDTEVSTSKSYNPFDDDDDDVGDNGDLANQTNVSRSKTAAVISSREKDLKLAKPRVTSPSELPKPKDGNVKKRRAPPPPTARPSDDPWTAKLPDDATTRRRRPVKPAKTEQQSPLTSSPAKTRTKRPAPAPPRRPPIIPSFDEWKTTASSDRSITGTNERLREASGAGTDGVLEEQRVTSRPSTANKGSPVAGKKTSGGEDGTNPADIKILARQVLMDARKKAGASGSLPRERVAKITKEREGEEEGMTTKGSPKISQRRRSTEGNKGQSLERLATVGTSGTNDTTQEKLKEENQEAATKRANLKQRKEELQRRTKKANEKAQKMVQNAIAKEKAEKTSTTSELPGFEQTATTSNANETAKYEDEKSESSDDGSNKKAAGKKSLQRRPLKLKDKESAGSSTESSERKLSTGKDPEPEKTGFQESEELQRIRAILNQGKSTGADNKMQQAHSPESSREDTRKSSDTKPSDYRAVNGESGSRTPKPLPRNKGRGPNAGLDAYVESRKMNFEGFHIPPAQTPQDNHIDTSLDTETNKGDNYEAKTADSKDMDEENQSLNSEDQESQNQSPEFQDKYEYVCQELKSLEEEQEALDRVGVKLETELRRAMQCKGCEEEQERLMQDWFLLVSKKNELVRRQEELNLMKNEEDLDRKHVMLKRELRALMDMKECQKTDEQRTREHQLIQELVRVVNQRDELVQFEDTQQQQAEEDAVNLQKMIDNVRVPKDKNDCVLQ